MRRKCITRSIARAPRSLRLNMQDVANNLNISLSSSEQVSPNFWTDPRNGIPYFMAVQTPEYRIADKNQLDNTPLASALDPSGTPIPTVLGNIATAERVGVQSVYNHSNIQPVYDIYAQRAGQAISAQSRPNRKIVAEVEPQLKPGNHIVIRGQIESMNDGLRQSDARASCSRRSSSIC